MASDHYQLARGRLSRHMNLGKERVDFVTPVFRQGVRAVGGNVGEVGRWVGGSLMGEALDGWIGCVC